MEKIKITFESDNCKCTYELPFDASIDDVLNVFYSGCGSLTYTSSTILEGMRDYADERLETINN